MRGTLPLRIAEFGLCSADAMCIHAVIAGPAVIARFITDITLGYSVFQAIKPKSAMTCSEETANGPPPGGSRSAFGFEAR